MPTIAVAVSGGVDSLCALLLLKKPGHSLIAIHGLFLPEAGVPAGLAECCRKLGAEFLVADLRAKFQREVIDYFVLELKSGRTPNPCALCNRAIKFDALLQFALAAGADKFATGHYALLDRASYSVPVLGKCLDSDKDQAYFLSMVNSRNLENVVFPLGLKTKTITRELVEKEGIAPPSDRESQDFCFQASGLSPKAGKPGPILLRTDESIAWPVEELSKIGQHNGLENYTLGQRKGLHVPWHVPLYVREILPGANALIVSPRQLLEMSGAVLENLNFFVPPQKWPETLFVRMRYRQPLMPAIVDFTGAKPEIRLKQNCLASAPGQIAAIHDSENRILAGGILEKIFFSDNQ